MAQNFVNVNRNLTKFIAIRSKYASGKLLRMSMILQQSSKAIRDLASPLLGQAQAAVAVCRKMLSPALFHADLELNFVHSPLVCLKNVSQTCFLKIH
ncbi:G2/mitotic-specific cyclin-B2-like [Erinaceus europaeus]|uniref:G2/mitotic-specific cyclin-B2-like n=1 Tax=Erinaceus europaeus TaxID=9365 RepID=A0ABM3WBX0_ERIEU|nr:G2/mitotic-specific cyclin-B2-like [Erinaceus europaeus]